MSTNFKSLSFVPWSFNYPLELDMGFSSGSTSRSLVDLIAGIGQIRDPTVVRAH